MLFILLNAAALIWIRHELNDEAKSHKFQITGYSPARNLDLADRFSLTFDQALVPADAVGKRLDRVPFWIEPEPDGHWEWASPTQLEYRLHRPLPPGRKYKIIAADDIEVQTGMRFSGPREMYFETRKLELNSYRLMA
ncbi:hypothetical protein HYR69_09925, partial [Candidatus Sumerlaeota bacterium]|nr:hypothetical protein [Candidatus Sumerlaeota bacterium]